MPVVCVAFGCSNYQHDGKRSFFRFPRNRDRCKKWLINCCGKDLDIYIKKDTLYFYRNYRLCSDHFEDSQFMNAAVKNKLKWNAVPTIFSIRSPSKTVTSVRTEVTGRRRKEALMPETALTAKQTSGACGDLLGTVTTHDTEPLVMSDLSYSAETENLISGHLSQAAAVSMSHPLDSTETENFIRDQLSQNGESVDSAASLRDLTANLFELQKSGYLCDTVLVADDGQLKAHSVVLAAASPVFKQVLKSSDQPLQHTILLPGMQLVVVSIIIQFIYTGKMMTTNDECGYSVKVMDAINDLGIKVHVSRDDGNGDNTEHQTQSPPHHFSSSCNEQGQSAMKEEMITAVTAAASAAGDLEPRENCDRDLTSDHITVHDHQYSVVFSQRVVKPPFVCNVCGKMFDKNFKLNRHVKQVHERRSKRSVVTGIDQADSIQSEMNSELPQSEMNSELARRDSVVDDDDEYSNVEVNEEQPSADFGAVCEMCGLFCDESESLETHMQTHSVAKSTECGVSVEKSTECGLSAAVDVDIVSQTMQKCCKPVTQVHAREATDSRDDDQSLSRTNTAEDKSHNVGWEEDYKTEDNMKAVCDVCGWVCVKSHRPRWSLSQHILQNHSAREPFKCGQCSRTLTSKHNLRRHEMLHAGVRRFLCQYCAQSFQQSVSLTCHLLKRHADKVDSDPNKWAYRCRFCSERFVHTCQLRRHVQTQHQSFLCELCGKTSCGSSKLHKCAGGKASAGDKAFSCSICGASYTCAARLNRHMTIHETDNTGSVYKCQLCSEEFELMTALKRHMSTTHSVVETHYQCSKCTKSFSTEQSLKQHMYIHSANAITCTLCLKKFAFQSQLKLHMASHTAFGHLRKFECSVCGKHFATKQTLEFHERIHSGTKPFVCNMCGKAFRQQVHLTQHWRTHTKMKPYSCSLCTKEYSCRIDLRHHCTRVHNIELPVARRCT